MRPPARPPGQSERGTSAPSGAGPPRSGPAKSPTAFRTIGEVSAELGVAAHVLRYWETRFPQLRPLQRAGNRRYYRPDDVALVRRIDGLLNREGYTVRGVQQLLAREVGAPEPADDRPDALRAIRDLLAAALDGD